jgi:hypothetical protein
MLPFISHAINFVPVESEATPYQYLESAGVAIPLSVHTPLFDVQMLPLLEHAANFVPVESEATLRQAFPESAGVAILLSIQLIVYPIKNLIKHYFVQNSIVILKES